MNNHSYMLWSLGTRLAISESLASTYVTTAL